jgi:hypothetical protein
MGETSIRHDQDSFTLISSDRQERVIHPSNTQIVRFESDPHMDCIERAFVDPHEYEAHEQLFIRDERILTIVEALGFKTVRFAETPDNYVDAYTSPRNHSSELEWDIQDFWRRGRDSNPRYRCRHTAFREQHLQPLGHLSIWSILTDKAASGRYWIYQIEYAKITSVSRKISTRSSAG